MSTIVHIGPANLPVTHRRGGAIERRMLELARAQVRRGHRVIVYSADSTTAATLVDGVEIRSICCRLNGSLRTLELTRRAVCRLRSEHITTLHFHSVPEGAILARALRAMTVLSYDDFRFRRGRATPLFWCYRHSLARFNALLPVSEYCRRQSLEYWKLAAANAQVVYNGVNLGQFAPDLIRGRNMRDILNLGDAPVVLYVGRVCQQKGTDVLLDAFSAVKAQTPAARLVVAGPALRFGNRGATDLTRRISAEGGLYLGAIDEADLPSLYNAADVFVMPTRSDEMFGMAALEAQACGKPVVCSRHGGLVEVISSQSGVFFPVGAATALATQICTLLDDSHLRHDLADAARDNARRFSWDAVAARLDTIYSATLNSHSMSAARLPV